ncbi:MAG: phosphate ABC transporter substrate-binding protein [Clostridiaceae bacterium]
MQVILLCISISILSACSRPSESGFIVAGSTSVQPYAEVLAEEYMILHPGAEIDIQGGGSSAGITAAKSGIASIGMSSRHLNDEEKSLWSIEIAKDGLGVIVHPSNQIDNLTLDQIRKIYSGEIKNWSEIGGKDAKIHIITREEGSGTRSAFAELVMEKTEITAKAIVQDSNGAVKQLIKDDENAIGYISLGLVDKDVKALHLNDVAANQENILNGSYTLSRPFLFVSLSEPTGETKQFVDFILSTEGQKMLSDEGLIPTAEGGK